MKYQQLKKIVGFYSRFTASFTQVGYRWRSLSWAGSRLTTVGSTGWSPAARVASAGTSRWSGRGGATVTAVARSESKLAALREDAEKAGIAVSTPSAAISRCSPTPHVCCNV